MTIPSALWKNYKAIAEAASGAKKPLADEFLKEVEDRILKAFGAIQLKALEVVLPLPPAMSVHQALADMRPFFPSSPPLMIPPLYNAADRKAKTAKNKRRSRARWRRREARRLEQELLCMREDGDPEREASGEVAAHALPAPAPKVAACGEEGKPGPGAGIFERNEIYDDLPFIECDEGKRYVFKIRTPLPSTPELEAPIGRCEGCGNPVDHIGPAAGYCMACLRGEGVQPPPDIFRVMADAVRAKGIDPDGLPSDEPLCSKPEANPLAIFCGERFRRPDEIARMNADQRRAVDDDAGLVPLPSKLAEPESRPYVPMKWGEHD